MHEAIMHWRMSLSRLLRALSFTLLLSGAAVAAETPKSDPPRPWIGERTSISRWAVAENRAKCAPLALVDDGGAKGVQRPAEFSGGWAVAFDLPGKRSAYGFAGAGLLDGDDQPIEEQRRQLAAQWPYMVALDTGLPAGSAAGYGLVGAAPYEAANPSGKGEESLAYLRVAGEACLYNVWSKLGRDHLLTLLNSLRVLRPAL